MFRKKKDLEERGQTLLKNKDVKSLRQDLLNSFPSLTEKKLDDLFLSYSPSSSSLKNVEILQIKLFNRTLLYSVNNCVLFFDLNGKKNYIPSCYTLWKIPYILSKTKLDDEDEMHEIIHKIEEKEEKKLEKGKKNEKQEKNDNKKKNKGKKKKYIDEDNDEEKEDNEEKEENNIEILKEDIEIKNEENEKNKNLSNIIYNNYIISISLYNKLLNGNYNIIIPSQVSSYLLKNGADLMSAGILSCPSLYKKDDIISICIYGNILPFAIGKLIINSEDIKLRKGKAVEIIHIYGDCLFSTDTFYLNSKASAINLLTPNEGFTLTQIYPVDINGKLKKFDEDNNDNEEGEGVEEEEEEERVVVVEGNEEKVEDNKNKNEENNKEEEEEEINHDLQFEEALLLCIKYIIKDKYLPILASNFWSQVQK